MSAVLVAGASGLLGSAVLTMLVAAGEPVYGTTRRRERLAGIERAGGRGVIMDALDPASVRRAMEQSEPTMVIHQLTDLSGKDFAGNARLREEGTTNLVEAALAAGVRTMVAQSISWAYRPGDGPAAEDEPFATDPDTGAPAFAAVEALEHQVARMPVGVVLRYGLLYGPGTWYAPDGDNTALARQGKITATTGWTSFVHLRDATAATVQALDWSAGAVNIVDDDPVHVDTWGPMYARSAGYVGTPSIVARTEGRAASNALARSRGWTPTYPTWRSTLGEPLVVRSHSPRPYGRR